MRILLIIIFVSVTISSFSQPNKSLSDSSFVKGDIIKVPELVFIDSRITKITIDSLNLIGSFLIKHPNFEVEIGCHTDSRGSAENNNIISELRAKSIRDYLISQFKIDSTTIKYKGYGESKPIVSEIEIQHAKTKEEKEKLFAINRRVELKILDFKK